jgi:histidyl-tRNA synthetase
MKLQLPKGTRDFSPDEMILRNKIVGILKRVFELYGYPPLETPTLERFKILASKYAGGSEILKETFRLRDQGKRELGLRYDLTVPLARFIGMNPNIKLPFKRYQIGDVYRDGPVESARYRQFTQCDVDIIGCSEMTAETELISMVNRAFKELGLNFVIKVNNRKLLNDILEYCNVEKSRSNDVVLTIDKLEKFGTDAVKTELKGKISEKAINTILKIITTTGSNNEKISKLKKIIKESEGLREIEELLALVGGLGIDIVFDVSLARGLSYYTGTVIEVFLKKSKVRTAVCAGGRYDRMIGEFLGKGNYPAVGVSFGLDRIYDACLEKNNGVKKTVTQLYIIPINTFNESMKIAEELRREGINVDIDLSRRGPSKNLKYANALNIPYVIFVGEEELKQGKVKLRDMKTGKEQLLTAPELVIFLNRAILSEQ